jgi:hypothetical protein
MPPSEYFVSIGATSRGPMPLDEVRRLWEAGVLDRHSLYWRQGMAQWEPLSEVLSLARQDQSVVPVAPVQHTIGAPILPRPSSNLAIASLVLGISAFMFCVTAIPGVIFGHMARREIRLSNGQLGGDGLAVAGLVISYLALTLLLVPLIMMLLFGIALPIFASFQS